jgi:hypothetical protein
MCEVRATVVGSTIKRVTTASGDSDGGGGEFLSFYLRQVHVRYLTRVSTQ